MEQLAVQMDLLGIHRNGLQAEMLDQLAQRIGPGHRVIVDFGDAGFIHCGRRIEFARDDLAADAVRRLIDGDTAEIAELLLEIPGAHQAARPPANDCKIKHLLFRRPRPSVAFKDGSLSHLSKSAFHPEGKMNKAGSCAAASKKAAKKAGASRPFSYHR